MSSSPPVTAQPVTDPDVLVIGGGIAGLFCAYFLRLAGHGVTVLERSAIGDPAGCSYGNTGFVGIGSAPLAGPNLLRNGVRSLLRPDDRLALAPSLDRDRLRWLWQLRRAGSADELRRGVDIMIELKLRSLAILPEVDVAVPAEPVFQTSGMVQAYRTAAGFERACRALPRAVANGVPLRVLERDELRELEPDAEFDIAGALYNESCGLLRAPDFSLALARTLTAMGVEIIGGSTVDGFEVSGRSVVAVRTSTGDLHPREVVLAAGSWSAELAGRLGLYLELQPIKGYSVTVRAPANGPRGPVLLVEGMVALRPLGDRLRFGGDMTLAGLDRSVSRRRIARMRHTVRQHLPALEPTETLEVWAGLRPCTPDSLPLLGRAPGYDNLTIAAGHGHNGMGLAPVSGQLIAELVSGRPTAMDISPFRLERFSNAPRWPRPGGTRPAAEPATASTAAASTAGGPS